MASTNFNGGSHAVADDGVVDMLPEDSNQAVIQNFGAPEGEAFELYKTVDAGSHWDLMQTYPDGGIVQPEKPFRVDATNGWRMKNISGGSIPMFFEGVLTSA